MDLVHQDLKRSKIKCQLNEVISPEEVRNKLAIKIGNVQAMNNFI